MISLSLIPHRSNHQRSYPFTGHLGLTEVSVHGLLKTTLSEDGIPLDASKIIVRVACYEGNLFGPCTSVRRLYQVEDTLWEAPAGSEYAPLADLERPFWLTVPLDAKSHGAVSMLSFKTWRVWWLLEAIIHVRPAPIFGSAVRKAHPLLMVDHAPPPFRAPPLWRGPNEHLLLCKATASSSAYGAGDLFSLKLDLRRRTAAKDFAIKRVTVELRRVIQRHAKAIQSEVSADDLPSTPAYEGKIDSPATSPDTQPSIGSDSYFPPISSIMPRRDETVLASMTREDFNFAKDGRWHGLFESLLPRNKTAHHYSLGETADNDNFSIKFYIHVKIVPVDKAFPVMDMLPTEISLSVLSRAERDAALAQVKRIKIVQDAERRLFQPGADGQCRATQAKKRASVSSESAAGRRASDGEMADDQAPRLSRQRLRSVDSRIRESVSRSSDPPPVDLEAPLLPKLSLPAFDRARLMSFDGLYARPSVSPVIEEATPKLLSTPSMLRRPVTPEELNLAPASASPLASDLYQKFERFNLAHTNSSTPPLSPTYPPSLASTQTSLSSSSRECVPTPGPLSPTTAASRAIPTSASMSKVPSAAEAYQSSLVRVQSADIGVMMDSRGRRRSHGSPFTRFFRRTSSGSGH